MPLSMTLRASPVEESATLPDGSSVDVRVTVPEDSYVAKRERDTVDVELRQDGRVIASVTTVLDADQVSEARELAREVVEGLESGRLEPTAHAIEPLADELRGA